MNQDLDRADGREDDPRELQFEMGLRRLPLRGPSRELDARIARLVRSVPRHHRGRPLLLAVAASIAVAMGTVPILVHRQPTIPPPPVVRGPAVTLPRPAAGALRVERQVARVADDGVIGTANGVPVQLLHYRAVRQIWYFDPHTGNKLQVTVPRDQVVLVPVRTF